MPPPRQHVAAALSGADLRYSCAPLLSRFVGVLLSLFLHSLPPTEEDEAAPLTSRRAELERTSLSSVAELERTSLSSVVHEQQ